jgi:hypothetical protein
MSEMDDLLREFPPGVRERLRAAWEEPPEGGRSQLIRALSRLLSSSPAFQPGTSPIGRARARL